jgi:hypothetical protein
MPSLVTYLASSLAALQVANALPKPFTIPYLDKSGRIEVQGHRGGLGMRDEESLWVCVPRFHYKEVFFFHPR